MKSTCDSSGLVTVLQRTRAVLRRSVSVKQESGFERRPKSPQVVEKEGSARACALCIGDAWGVKPKARPAGQTDDSCCTGDREDRRRRTRRIGAAAALERLAVPNEVQTGAAGAPAQVPRAMRPALRRCRRSKRSTHAQIWCSGACREERTAWRRRRPHRCEPRRARGRAERGGERGAKRPRERRCRLKHRRSETKRAAPPPEQRCGPRDVAVRLRCAGPGCRAAAPCRRGSR